MKKLLAFITALLVLSAVLFAEVTVKDLGDGNVEVTFFYGNPRATEVWVAGSFTEWAAGAVPMTKVAAGWEYKAVFPVASELKYKFLVNDLNGWTRDFKAPAEVDDGFGGFNGLVEVARLVEIEKAKASGDTSALEALMAGGLKFGNYTQLTLMSTFQLREYADPTAKGFQTENVELYADSNWKFDGDVLPGINLSMEVKAFSSTTTLYAIDPTGLVTQEIAEGVNELATGLAFYPFNYLKGGDPMLGKFKVGLETPYVNLETGYFWSQPTKRSTIIWQTIGEVNADKGYFQIANGEAIQNFGDVKIDAAVVPNMTYDAMAVRSWVAATAGDYTVELQWDAKSTAPKNILNKVTDPADDKYAGSDFFDQGYANLIAGAKGSAAGATFAAQVSIPMAFGDLPEASEEVLVTDAMAYQVNLGYATDMFGVATEFGIYQPNADLMYTEQDGDDKLFDNKGKALIKINPWVIPVDGVKVGLDNEIVTTYEFDTALVDGGYLAYGFKPWVNLDLAKIAGQNMVVDAYAKFAVNLTEYPSGIKPDDTFFFNELGVKVAMKEVSEMVPSIEINYGLQNEYKVKMFNTLIASATTKPGIGVDAGIGLRLVNADAGTAVEDANEAFAFLLGADYTITALKNGVFYGSFVYNMDAYDSNKDELDWDGYRPDKGIDELAGKAKFRLGMKWDF